METWEKMLKEGTLDKIEIDSAGAIIHSIGDYVRNYIQARMNIFEERTETSILKPQSTAGLYLVSGGCLGLMFSLYKRERRRGNTEAQKKLRVLSKMIIFDKSRSSKLPVEVWCRDKGGLYIFKPEYMDMVKSIDTEIMNCVNVTELQKHKKRIIRLTTDKILQNKDLEAVFVGLVTQSVGSEVAGELRLNIVSVWTDFLRKYTHARINGIIKGIYEKKVEKSGKRLKGGSSLRETLYNLGKTRNPKHSKSTPSTSKKQSVRKGNKQ
ncbi:uncharacterized protein LOC141906253 [Tubulanus polymorphus]|uniref:uncharacterized protein LOC141906253 n=1 Tax=Tubulanus polymorphus TaxID=672921 RepID=UPI003DA2A77E